MRHASPKFLASRVGPAVQSMVGVQGWAGAATARVMVAASARIGTLQGGVLCSAHACTASQEWRSWIQRFAGVWSSEAVLTFGQGCESNSKGMSRVSKIGSPWRNPSGRFPPQPTVNLSPPRLRLITQYGPSQHVRSSLLERYHTGGTPRKKCLPHSFAPLVCKLEPKLSVPHDHMSHTARLTLHHAQLTHTCSPLRTSTSV